MAGSLRATSVLLPLAVSRFSSRWLQAVSRPVLTAPAAILPVSMSVRIPTTLADIWESILRAVPKKKTSYRKKRSRQMAGKALKDRIDINRCSSCGAPKRAHLLCPNCVKEVQQKWREQATSSL